jgi:putative tryptophan/tyrosine transport system substrate-binding protein
MRRREFIAGLGGAAAWPVVAWAQPQRPVIGHLSASTQGHDSQSVERFLEGLRQTGFVEGSNVTIEYRWANDDGARLPSLATDLVRRNVAAIVATGIPAAKAAKAATDTIPIVFITGADPVKLGLVASLSRPGGNVTGVTNLYDELGSKRLEIMHELLPAATDFALLIDPTNPISEPQTADMRAAAQVLGLNIHMLHATDESGYDAAFADAVRLRTAGLMVGPNNFSLSAPANQQLVLVAARYAMPTMSFTEQFTAAGGLMSYGSGNAADFRRLVGVYVGRILKGVKPADLPVQQPTKIDLVINQKTAKLLGLTVPSNLLAIADEVIQ